MIVRATETFAFGFIDTRGFIGTTMDDPRTPIWNIGDFLWPFDAECRGYCMQLWGKRGPYRQRP